MDRYVGLDAHATSCTFGVLDAKGKQIASQVVETNGKALVDFVRAQGGEVHLCLEEGTQSAWLYEILSHHVKELVVIGLTESRGQKSDERDALALAEKLRTGAFDTTVYKGTGEFGELRELSRAYTMVSRDVVRVQNRIKSLYRSRGIATEGKEVFGPTHRQSWLRKLPPKMRAAAEVLHEQYVSAARTPAFQLGSPAPIMPA